MALVKTENTHICVKVGQVVENLELLKFSSSSGDISISIEYDNRWSDEIPITFADIFLDHQERVTEHVLRGEKEIKINHLLLSRRGQEPMPGHLELNYGVVFERKLFVIIFELKGKALEFYKK